MSLPSTMTLGTSTYTYFNTIDDDKIVYHGINHTDKQKETLEFIRTNPKRSGANYGTRRGYLRFTTEVDSTQADDSVKTEFVVSNASINWPVGVADPTAIVTEELDKLLGALSGANIISGDYAYTAGNLLAIASFFIEGKV